MRRPILAVLATWVVALAACAGAAPQASPSPAVATDVAVSGAPSGLAFDFGSLWVGLGDKGIVVRIDPATATITKQVTVGDPSKLLARARNTHNAPSAVVSAFGAIWAVGADGKLARIDPATNDATVIDIGVVGEALASGEGSLWIASYDDGALVRVDPTARAVTKTITGLGGLFGVAVTAGSVWAVNKTGHEVLRIDPTSGAVTARIPAERSPDWVAVGAGSVWVTRETPRAVLRIDPSTNAVVATILGDPTWGIGTGIAFYDGAVWSGFLVRIDAATGKVTGTFNGPTEQRLLAFGGGSAWIADVTTVHRVPLALVR